MKIVLSETLSYCFGVRKTLELTDELLADRPDRTYYMLGEIVHNEHVIEALRAKGLRIVQTLDAVPAGGIVILQSHGSTRKRYDELAARGLEFVDATCPMVRIIHDRIRAVEAQGRVPVVIGQVGHEEVRGIVGQVARALVVKSPDEVTPELFAGVLRAGVVAQSTFIEEEARRIVERIRALVPDVVFHDTICQPTKTRQREVETHTRKADCVIVIGSRHSANTQPPLQHRPGHQPADASHRQAGERRGHRHRSGRDGVRRLGRVDAHGAHRRGRPAPRVPGRIRAAGKDKPA